MEGLAEVASIVIVLAIMVGLSLLRKMLREAKRKIEEQNAKLKSIKNHELDIRVDTEPD